jgi:truncated hemoglobin YjbI
MKQITLFLILLAMPCIIQAQKDEKAIKAVINRFFEAMEKGDTTALLSTCMPDPVFQTYMKEKNGELQMYTENFSDFVRFLGSPRKDTDTIHVLPQRKSKPLRHQFFSVGKNRSRLENPIYY